MALPNGRVGQVLGDFGNEDLLADGGAISNFTPEVTRPILLKLGVQAEPGTIIRVNDKDIRIGRTGIYEIGQDLVAIKSLSFPNGVTDCQIDFIY